MRASAVISLLWLCCGACHSDRGPATRQASARPPIILITIDTLRADRLGSYGSRRGLTLSLDAFAREATRFTVAVTQVPLTLPSHATMLTGLHPAHHGIRTNDGFRLSPAAPTLAASLKAAGYATGAFIGGYPLRRSSGLSRGFDRYDDEFLAAPDATERPADAVMQSASAWIDANATTPFFAWIHLFDPHSPYTPPAPFAAAHRDNPYDGEVAYTDAAVGRFLDRLRQRDLFTPAAIIVVADHGESLGEHGERTHGTFLYDATIRVPMLIKMATVRVTPQIDVPVETADLAPTIAAIAGARLDHTDGRSVLPLIDGAAGDADRPAYAESFYQNVLLGWSPLRAVRTARWKLIDAPRSELYDLEDDAGELQNRLAERATLASGLQRALRALESGRGATDEARGAATRESAERLRSLGYASGSTVPTAASTAIDPKDHIAVWAEIEDGIHTHGKETCAGDGLPQKNAQEGISLAGRRVEHVHRGERRPIGPAIGRDPLGLGTRNRATGLGGHAVPIAQDHMGSGVLQGGVVFIQSQYSAEFIIHSRGKVLGHFPLHDYAHAIGVEFPSLIRERIGVKVWQHISAIGRDRTNPGQGWILDVIGIGCQLNIVLAEPVGERDFLMVAPLQRRCIPGNADARPRFTQVGRSGIKTLLHPIIR